MAATNAPCGTLCCAHDSTNPWYVCSATLPPEQWFLTPRYMEKSLSYLRLQRTRKQRDIHTQRDWNPDTNAHATASAKTAHHLPHSQDERVAQPNVPHPALTSPHLRLDLMHNLFCLSWAFQDLIALCICLSRTPGKQGTTDEGARHEEGQGSDAHDLRSSSGGSTGIWCTWPKELDRRKHRDLMLMTQFQALQNDPTIVFGCCHHLHREFLLLCFNSSHFLIPRKKSLFQGFYLPTLVAASLWNEDHRYRCDQAMKGDFHQTCEKKVTLVASDTRMEQWISGCWKQWWISTQQQSSTL
jgi:hypothetical protein